MEHPRSAVERGDEGRLHTFVVDHCFQSNGAAETVDRAAEGIISTKKNVR